MTTSPERPGRDWDAEFAAITSRLDIGDDPQEAPAAPVSGANRNTFRPTPRPEPSVTEADAGLAQSTAAKGDVPADAPPPVADPDVTDAEGHHDADEFVPAQPAPLETDDPATVIMIGCLVAGPLWLLYLTIFDRDTAALWWLLAALTLTTGFVLAVMRQPRRRDDEDDDGARV